MYRTRIQCSADKNTVRLIQWIRTPDNLSIVFAGQNVGVKQVSDKVWLVSSMKYDLGFFDEEAGRVTSVDNPFDAKVLPMCPPE